MDWKSYLIFFSIVFSFCMGDDITDFTEETDESHKSRANRLLPIFQVI